MKESPDLLNEPEEFHLPDTHESIIEARSDLQDSESELEDMRQVVKDMEEALAEIRLKRKEAEAELDELYGQLADELADWLPGPVQIGVIRDEAKTTREMEARQEKAVASAREILAELERSNLKLKELLESNIAQLREIDARFGRQAGVFKGKNPRAQA